MSPEPREIVRDLALTPAEHRLLDLHSVANVLTLLAARLQVARQNFGDDPAWAGIADRLPDLVHEGAAGLVTLEDILAAVRGLQHRVLPDLDARAGRLPARRDEIAELREALGVLFETAAVRLEELLFGDRHAFHRVEASFIRGRLQGFLEAAERHASGAWRFQFEPPAPPDGWLLRITVGGPGGTLAFPSVLHDVLRDLVANARKYSAPGSTIGVRVEEARDCLEVEVRDEGRGIPSDEIDRVVEFGFRASNASDRPTAGIGAGLTKAYVEARRLGGRLWIGSQPERGTLVRLVIPIASPPEPSSIG